MVLNDVGKCVDFRLLSKKCTACASWEKRQGTIEYEKFISEHDCLVNHSGSAGSMEAVGVVECFQLSVKDRKLRYITSCDDTWCKYWKDKLNNEKQFVEQPGMQ